MGCSDGIDIDGKRKAYLYPLTMFEDIAGIVEIGGSAEEYLSTWYVYGVFVRSKLCQEDGCS